MRIQSINQNNNISHKAYFKPNTEFKKLWGARPKYFGNKLVDLRKNLPNHELEILTCEKVAGDLVDNKLVGNRWVYRIFNNETKKAVGIPVAFESDKRHLEVILEVLLSKHEKVQDFFENDPINTLQYETATEPEIILEDPKFPM